MDIGNVLEILLRDVGLITFISHICYRNGKCHN